jgi:hypothetical protein
VRLPGVVSLRPTRRAQRRSPPANASISMFRLYTPLRPSGGARLVEPGHELDHDETVAVGDRVALILVGIVIDFERRIV